MAKRYFAKCDLDDGQILVKKGDELFLSNARPNWLYRNGHYVCHTTSNQMEYIEVREEQQGHVHAELMMQYAQDAMETDKPWELWEFCVSSTGEWLSATAHPFWHDKCKYRRKPKMISVTLESGEVVSWPEPEKNQPTRGSDYYHIDGTYTVKQSWFGGSADMDRLDAGIAHLTEEAACQHRDALLKINTQGRDNG